MAILSSTLRLSLLDRVTGPAARVNASLARLRGQAQAQTAAMAGMGRSMLVGAAGFMGAYGLVRGIRSSVTAAADFQQAMNQVSAVSGATGGQLQDLRRQALELGRTTQFTATDAANAQNFLAMAGFKANDILGAMPDTLQLASAAQMDLGRTADVVSNILTGYRMEVSDLAHVNDVLVKAFTSANTDLGQLAEAMKYAGPIASSAGVRFEEATAALSLMGNAGIQGSMAGTSLRGALSRVLDATPKVRSAMRSAGLTFTDTAGRLLPLADIIEQLEPHAENTGLFMELFGQRAGPAMAALVGQGHQALRKLDDELVNSGGTAKRVADVQMQGFQGRMRELRSATEGFMIALGDRLIPAITPGVQGLTNLFGQMTGFMESLDRRVTVFDQMRVGLDGLVSGMGFRDAGDMLARFRDFAVEGLFGSENRLLEDAEALGRLSVTTRRIGENFRAAADSILGGSLLDGIGSLKDAFADMPAMGQILTLYAMGKGLGLLAGGVSLLAGSPWVRGALALYAMANLIDRFRGAEDFSQFVDSLKELSTIEWLGIAAGALVVSGVLWKLGRNVVSLTRGMKSLFALKPPSAAPGAGRPGGAVPPSASSLRPQPWGTQQPAGPISRGRPTGPGGGLARGVRAAPWQFSGWQGIRGALGRGLLAGAAAWLGERAIEGGFRAAGKEPVELPSILDNIRTILDQINVERKGGTGDGPAWDALREIPTPQDHIRELEEIRRLMQGDGSPDDVSIQNVPTVDAPPQGVQDVRVTNPPPAPVIHNTVTVHATTGASATEIANQVATRVGQETRDALAGIHSDTGYSVT